LLNICYFKRDNIIWDEEQEKLAQQKVNENSIVMMSSEQLSKYETEADKYWDKFYGIHNNGYVHAKINIFSVKLFRMLNNAINQLLIFIR